MTGPRDHHLVRGHYHLPATRSRPCLDDHPAFIDDTQRNPSDQLSFRRPRPWPGAPTFRAVTAMAARYAILPSPGRQRRTHHLNSGPCPWRYGCVSQDGGAAIPRPSLVPRPYDYETDDHSRTRWLQTDLACSGWMRRWSRRLPTDPEGSSG